MISDACETKNLVLLGGGHSHVAVLRMFGQRPLRGVQLTLISKEVMTPYSGMLPGFIAGHYKFEEAHIDLRRLCRFANAQFIEAEVSGLELAGKSVHCAGGPSVRFDLLSVNTGSTPRVADVPGAREFTLPVKPIRQFLQGWESIVQQAESAAGRVFQIVVVGGGAGGVELSLSAQHRLRSLVGKTTTLEFHLVADSPTVLPTHNRRVQKIFTRILKERGIRAHLNQRVVSVEAGKLKCSMGAVIAFDATLWVTHASAPGWIAESGLQTDAAGFILVNDFLQSVSHPFVFAAGDVATLANHPRPKSGVFAVREGRPLYQNLMRTLSSQPLQPFRPQHKFLSLISTGNRYAVASRGRWALAGAWIWRWKNWIDKRWMRQYLELPSSGGE